MCAYGEAEQHAKACSCSQCDSLAMIDSDLNTARHDDDGDTTVVGDVMWCCWCCCCCLCIQSLQSFLFLLLHEWRQIVIERLIQTLQLERQILVLQLQVLRTLHINAQHTCQYRNHTRNINSNTQTHPTGQHWHASHPVRCRYPSYHPVSFFACHITSHLTHISSHPRISSHLLSSPLLLSCSRAATVDA